MKSSLELNQRNNYGLTSTNFIHDPEQSRVQLYVIQDFEKPIRRRGCHPQQFVHAGLVAQADDEDVYSQLFGCPRLRYGQVGVDVWLSVGYNDEHVRGVWPVVRWGKGLNHSCPDGP